jgi:3'(2'), 5'-bisphosphate nucleotidase
MNLSPIMDAVRRASLLCREVQKLHIVENSKTGNEPVTIADYGSQAIINRAIRAAFPHDAIMAEENGTQFMALVADEQKRAITGLVSAALGQPVSIGEIAEWLDYATLNTGAGRVWVVDPIDGTKGFLAYRHYCVAIGVLQDGQPTAAVMGCPAYPGFDGGALFTAQDGAAYRMPLTDVSAAPQRVHASDRVKPEEVRVLESVEKSHVGHERMARVQQLAGYGASPVERVDSQEKYARIAAGDGELYLRLPRLNSTRGHSTWDHAAGTALLFAGGGTVTDIDGTPLDFTTGRELANNQGMIVSNGRFHDRILDAVRIVLEEEAQARDS